jgi:hypothetical protein
MQQCVVIGAWGSVCHQRQRLLTSDQDRQPLVHRTKKLKTRLFTLCHQQNIQAAMVLTCVGLTSHAVPGLSGGGRNDSGSKDDFAEHDVDSLINCGNTKDANVTRTHEAAKKRLQMQQREDNTIREHVEDQASTINHTFVHITTWQPCL